MADCSQCVFKTSSRKALREHAKVHDTTERNYRCTTCGYVCLSHSTLKSHLKMHCDDRPFRCPHCSYSSKQNSNMLMHMRRRHKQKSRQMVRDADGEEKPTAVIDVQVAVKRSFPCELCEATFVREDSLKAHVRCHRQSDATLDDDGGQMQPSVLSVDDVGGGGSDLTVDCCHTQTDNVDELSDGHYSIIQNSRSAADSADDITLQQAGEPTRLLITNRQSSQCRTSRPSMAETSAAQTAPSCILQPDIYIDAFINVATSANLVAFMQNNQNMAVEDNMHNITVSSHEAHVVEGLTTTTEQLAERYGIATQPIVSTQHQLMLESSAMDSSNELEIALIQRLGIEQQPQQTAAVIPQYVLQQYGISSSCLDIGIDADLTTAVQQPFTVPFLLPMTSVRNSTICYPPGTDSRQLVTFQINQDEFVTSFQHPQLTTEAGMPAYVSLLIVSLVCRVLDLVTSQCSPVFIDNESE